MTDEVNVPLQTNPKKRRSPDAFKSKPKEKKQALEANVVTGAKEDVKPKQAQVDVKKIGMTPQNEMLNILDLGKDDYFKKQTLVKDGNTYYFVQKKGDKSYKGYHLKLMKRQSGGLKFWNKTPTVPNDNLTINPVITEEELAFLNGDWLEWHLHYLHDNAETLFSEKIANHLKSVDFQGAKDFLMMNFTQQWQGPKPSKKDAKIIYPPNWTLKITLQKNTGRPDVDIFDVDGSPLYYLPKPSFVNEKSTPQQLATAQEEKVLYEASLAKMKEKYPSAHEEVINLVRYKCENDYIIDILGIAIMMGKSWSFVTRCKQIKRITIPENNGYIPRKAGDPPLNRFKINDLVAPVTLAKPLPLPEEEVEEENEDEEDEDEEDEDEEDEDEEEE